MYPLVLTSRLSRLSEFLSHHYRSCYRSLLVPASVFPILFNASNDLVPRSLRPPPLPLSITIYPLVFFLLHFVSVTISFFTNTIPSSLFRSILYFELRALYGHWLP